MVYQFTLIRNDANIIDLTLRLRNKVLMGLLSVTLSLLIAFVFIKYLNMGVVGLCLGIIIGRMILSIGYPVLISRYLAIPWLSQLRTIVRPAAITILLFSLISIISVSSRINSWIDHSGWIGLIFSSGITFLLFFAISFYVGLNKFQRNNILRRFTAIVAVMPA